MTTGDRLHAERLAAVAGKMNQISMPLIYAHWTATQAAHIQAVIALANHLTAEIKAAALAHQNGDPLPHAGIKAVSQRNYQARLKKQSQEAPTAPVKRGRPKKKHS